MNEGERGRERAREGERGKEGKREKRGRTIFIMHKPSPCWAQAERKPSPRRGQAEPRPGSHVVLTRRASPSPSPSLSLRLSWTCHMTPKKELSLI